jgi:hypothetical protein
MNRSHRGVLLLIVVVLFMMMAVFTSSALADVRTTVGNVPITITAKGSPSINLSGSTLRCVIYYSTPTSTQWKITTCYFTPWYSGSAWGGTLWTSPKANASIQKRPSTTWSTVVSASWGTIGGSNLQRAWYVNPQTATPRKSSSGAAGTRVYVYYELYYPVTGFRAHYSGYVNLPTS